MRTTSIGVPRDLHGRVQLAAAVLVVLLTFVGSAAVRVHSALADPGSHEPVVDVTTATSTPIVPAPPVEPAATFEDGFTIGDLAAGRVPQDVQDRFWQAQLDAILAAPCPEAPAGGTVVTLHLGADEAWTARLAEASAARAADCAA